MKNIFCSCVLFSIVFVTACKKEKTDDLVSVETVKKNIAANFSNSIALPTYADLVTASADLQAKLQLLDTTDNNLQQAKTSWLNQRTLWNISEGFLFGPVKTNQYNVHLDSVPTRASQMDSLLADTSNHLTVAEVQALPSTLRGYHPIEYMLWGISGNKPATDLTVRQKLYLASLAQDINNTLASLYRDWQNGFALQVSAAGTTASTTYPKFIDLFTEMNNSMIAICEEVGGNKLYKPFVLPGDSTIVESPYSGNSLRDFQNNIQGALNVYLGTYITQKTGMTDLVQMYNKDLDTRIKQKFIIAINTFSTVNTSFDVAIYSERVPLQNIMNAVADVKTILKDELKPFLIDNVKN